MAIETYSTGKTYLEFTETDKGVAILIEVEGGYGNNRPPNADDWKTVAQDLAEAIYDLRHPDQARDRLSRE